MKRFLMATIVIFFAMELNLFAADITVKPPSIYPDTKENRVFIEELIKETAHIVDRLYGDTITIDISAAIDKSAGGKGSEASVLKSSGLELVFNAVNSPDSKIISVNLTRTKDGKAAEPFNYLSDWESGLGPMMGRMIFYMWASLDNFAAFPLEKKPVFVDEFYAESIRSVALPVPGLQLYPYSLAVKSNGNVIVGANSMALELNRNFAVVDFPGKSLVEEGNYTYAFGVGVTPAGTVMFKPSTGSDVYSLIPGADKPRRIRTGISAMGPFVTLPDSSMVFVDITQRKALRLAGKDRIELPIFSGPYSYITTAAADADGNLWVGDATDKHLKIYSPDGLLVDSILPLASSEDLGGVKGIAVYANGDFLLLTQTRLMKFRRNGTPEWKLENVRSPYGETSLTMVMGMGVDSPTGLIYLTDYTGRKVLKLLDIAYAEKNGVDISTEKKFLALNDQLFQDPYDADALKKKAILYEKSGAFEAAYSAWEMVMESDPFDSTAEERLDAIELASLKAGALDLNRKTLEILDTLGPESARAIYSRAVQVYEKISNLAPQDTEAAQELRKLKDAFALKEGGAGRKQTPLIISNVVMNDLFPALSQTYRDKPVGKVTIKNPLSETAKNLRCEVFIKNYMDFPYQTKIISSLAAAGTADFDINVALNQSVFSLEEDLPVQTQITLIYDAGGEEQKVTAYKTITLYRKSAMSWDRSGKLASFITPNEGVISAFAHRVAGIEIAGQTLRIAEPFLRAMRICDALGSYGINYVEDPQSPFAGDKSDRIAVDTVRFPRTTLYYRSGDCDDSTALLGSLLESAGIPTAIMTSPGHVFLAFNTGEPEGNKWMYEGEGLDPIIYENTIWIPLESTNIRDGFYEAWRKASELVRVHDAAGETEFLPVKEQWRDYPPMPLPESGISIIEPLPDLVSRLAGTSTRGLRRILYEAPTGEIKGGLTTASAVARYKLLNRLGILHARFGEDKLAEETFNLAMKEKPDSVAGYINYANLMLLTNRPKDAYSALEQGRARMPESAMVNLLLARVYYQAGDGAEAKKYLAEAEKKSPDLAEQFAYIKTDGVSRAGNVGGAAPMLWDGGE